MYPSDILGYYFIQYQSISASFRDELRQGYFYVDLVGIKGILTEQKESASLSPFSGLLLVRNSVRFLASLDPCQRFLTEKHHYVGRNTIIFGVYWPF